MLLKSASASAVTIFTEPFDYAVGENLQGQNGGSGFSGAWSGGNSTIVNGFMGASAAVQVGDEIASRSLSTVISTSSGDIFVAYRVRVSDFTNGNYTGLSFWHEGNEQFFYGIPWDAQKFGFDAHAGNGGDDIKTVNFTPAADTVYLIILGLVDSPNVGMVDIKLWATSDLSTTAETLVGGNSNAELLNVKPDFSISSIRLAGNMQGSLKLGGLGSATTALEAAELLTPIPEPSTYGLIMGGLTLAAVAVRRRVKATKKV